MVPLLHHHVAAGVVRPSPAVAREIAASARTFARRSLTLAAELATLLRACRERDLVIVPLKGPVLAHQLYGSVTARQMDDLDILVGHGDVERVRVMLEARGYRRFRRWPADLDPLVDAQARHLAMIDAQGHVVVEVHSRVSDEGAFRQTGTLDALRPYLVAETFLGRDVLVLRPEMLLVYLGVHGASHGWSRVGWVAAFAELARSGQVRDWDEVRACAGRWGVWRHVLAGLDLADALFGDEFGARIGERGSADRAVRRANGRLWRGLCLRPDAPLTEAGRLRYLLSLDSSLVARARRCRRTLMAPMAPDAMALPVPRPLWPVLAAFRPIRLLTRQIARMARSRQAGQP